MTLLADLGIPLRLAFHYTMDPSKRKCAWAALWRMPAAPKNGRKFVPMLAALRR